MTELPRDGTVWAAGGVLHRRRNGAVEVLLVHRPRYDDWSLPKGKVDPGETLLETARREVAEETGIAAAVAQPVGTVAYRPTERGWKVVRWWLMEAGDGSFVPNAEVDEAAWLTSAEAERRLTYPSGVAVLRRGVRLAEDPTAGVVYLTRHGLAGRRGEWDASDRDRPLEERGRRQALRLTAVLAASPITRILTSGYRRCAQTVAPLGKLLGIGVETHRALEEGGGAGDALELLAGLSGEAPVVSTHGDVAGAVVGRLHAEGVPLEGPLRWEKGSIWVLETRGGAVTAGRYVPPPGS